LEDTETGIKEFRENYAAYFEANKSLLPAGYVSHGNDPKVIIVPGVGAVTAATTIKENAMLADIASHTTALRHESLMFLEMATLFLMQKYLVLITGQWSYLS